MSHDPLWPFLLFEGLEGDALVQAYREVYLETYVKDRNGQARIFTDWAGAQVVFPSVQFDHAFSKTDRYRQGLDHDQFSLERAKRMLWIREVLAGSKGTINRYAQTVETNRRRQVKRRTFLVTDENYFVVLNDPCAAGTPFHFVTAYAITDFDYLQKLKRKSVLLETIRRGR